MLFSLYLVFIDKRVNQSKASEAYKISKHATPLLSIAVV